MPEARPRTDEPIRRTVRYSGRVQGVGFRATARSVAGRFRVTGYVQNLADGRVLLVVEGVPDEVERFCAALAAAMERNIATTDIEQATTESQFTDFTIKY